MALLRRPSVSHTQMHYCTNGEAEYESLLPQPKGARTPYLPLICPAPHFCWRAKRQSGVSVVIGRLPSAERRESCLQHPVSLPSLYSFPPSYTASLPPPRRKVYSRPPPPSLLFPCGGRAEEEGGGGRRKKERRRL